MKKTGKRRDGRGYDLHKIILYSSKKEYAENPRKGK